MPNMCTGAFYVLQRLNNSCAIYAIYTVVRSMYPHQRIFFCNAKHKNHYWITIFCVSFVVMISKQFFCFFSVVRLFFLWIAVNIFPNYIFFIVQIKNTMQKTLDSYNITLKKSWFTAKGSNKILYFKTFLCNVAVKQIRWVLNGELFKIFWKTKLIGPISMWFDII